MNELPPPIPSREPAAPAARPMRNFLMGAAKVAIGIFAAVLGLAAAAGAAYWAKLELERREAEPYTKVVEWKDDLIVSIGMQAVVRTKLMDNRMLLSLQMDGRPRWLIDPLMWRENRENGEVTVIFYDQDGFKVTSQRVPLLSFSKVIDDKNEIAGLSVESGLDLPLKDYQRIKRMQIQWRMVTDKPRAAPVPVPTPEPVAANGDHCAPGLSRAERLSRLTAHGELRQVGSHSYQAGSAGRHVSFYTDGSLMFCG